jgi:hypothetical protein
MKTTVRCSVDDGLQYLGLTAAQTHVGDGTLVSGLSGSSVLSFGGGGLDGSLFSSPLHTTDHIAHATASVGSEDLDGNDVGSLGNTVAAGGDGARAMGAMSVVVLVHIVRWDGRTPGGTTLEFDVGDPDAGVDDVDVDALAALGVVQVLLEGAEGEFGTVTDARKTLIGR